MKPPARVSRFASHPAAPLIAVAVAYAIAQFAAGTARVGLGWDETVYVSQTSPRVPAAFFSAPRARGVTLLPAPILALTPSVTVLRAYLTMLSSAGLVVAYWPWTRLARPVTAALAAALLASLWMVRFYGNEVMPNLYVAYGAVAATGWFVLTVRHPDRRLPPVWLVASLAFVALMRPGDALWLALPLAAVAAFAGGRRLVLACAIGLGLAAGWAQWIVEAYVRFGGPLRRLRASSRNEGGLGWHPAGIRMELHALNDYLLCRPCSGATWHVSPISLWWPLLPPLTAGGLALAARERRSATLAVPAACGFSLAASYLLLIGYAAPRFLIPAYALLALPVAQLPVGAVSAGPRSWRLAAAGVTAAGLIALAGTQHMVLTRVVAHQTAARHEFTSVAVHLHDLGIRPPCTLSGDQAQPLAFYAGCRSMQASGRNTSTTLPGLLTEAASTNFATIERTGRRPHYTNGWRRYGFTTPAGRHWRVYLPVPAAAAPRG